MIGDVKALIEFQTKLQGVANSVAKEMVDALNASDRELLETVRKGIVKPFNGKSLKESFERLQKLCEQVYEIRKKAIDNAKIVMNTNGEKIAENLSKQSCENLKKTTKKKIKAVPKKKLEDIIKYQPFQGKTIDDWFSSWKESDKYRIVSAIQNAVNTGITPQKAIDLIRGTINPDNGKREGGVLDVSRSSASMIARTITNGVANEARLATLDENEDVIDGVQFLSTLDGKTSFLCASLDGTIWLNKDRDKVKRPPLHPNCRSTLIPYIILHDENGNVIEDEDSRPMANADFDQYAKEQYEKKYPGKKFSDLAQTTRDNYYYKAQNQYEKETGKPAYSQTSGKTTFKDYFENQPDDFKRSWLGEKRFELYKDGKLKFDQLVKPDSGYVVPLSELDQKDGPDMSPTVQSPTKPPIPQKTSSYVQTPDEKIALNGLSDKPVLPDEITVVRKMQTTPQFDDIDEAKKYLLERFGISVDVDGIDQDVIQGSVEEIDIVLSNIIGNSEALKNFKSFKPRKFGVAGQYVPSLKMIQLPVGTTKDGMAKTAAYCKSSGWWSSGDWRSTIRHELGHVVQAHFRNLPGYQDKMDRIEELCKKVNEKDRSISLSIYGLNKGRNKNKNYRAGEAIAESFSCYMEGDPTKLANEILTILFE